MKKYLVNVSIDCFKEVEVEANSEAEAQEKAMDKVASESDHILRQFDAEYSVLFTPELVE